MFALPAPPCLRTRKGNGDHGSGGKPKKQLRNKNNVPWDNSINPGKFDKPCLYWCGKRRHTGPVNPYLTDHVHASRLGQAYARVRVIDLAAGRGLLVNVSYQEPWTSQQNVPLHRLPEWEGVK